jgi:hypothetical protein
VIASLALGLSLLACLPALAATGDFFGDLFAPPGMSQASRLRLEQRSFSREHAGGMPFGLAQTRLELSTPVAASESSSWRANLFADYDAIESGASLPGGRLMPNRLWDPGLGVSHSRTLEDGRTAGGSLTVSSPGDRPFSKARDLGLNLHLTYKMPQSDGNAWILFLSVSNTRGFLPYVPLPGAAYYFRSGRKLRGLAGVPFVLLHWTPADRLAVTFFYFPLRTAELKVAFGEAGALQPYALVSYRTRNYMLSDRPDPKERLFYEEGTAQAGVLVPLGKAVGLDFAGGQSFGRRYFTANKITDRSDAPTMRPDNALFAAAKLQALF